MTRKIDNVPPLCKISTEAGRTYFEIDKESPSGEITVWWDRSLGRNDEVLFIRQEALHTALSADVMQLTHAQAYALLDALNRALELP